LGSAFAIQPISAAGLAIYLETGKTQELIGIVEDAKRLNLNSDAFSFV
jgi:hypothetical protein